MIYLLGSRGRWGSIVRPCGILSLATVHQGPLEVRVRGSGNFLKHEAVFFLKHKSFYLDKKRSLRNILTIFGELLHRITVDLLGLCSDLVPARVLMLCSCALTGKEVWALLFEYPCSMEVLYHGIRPTRIQPHAESVSLLVQCFN